MTEPVGDVRAISMKPAATNIARVPVKRADALAAHDGRCRARPDRFHRQTALEPIIGRALRREVLRGATCWP